MKTRVALTVVVLLSLSLAGSGQAPAGLDWPQWRGPDRDRPVEGNRTRPVVARFGSAGRLVDLGLGAGYGAVAVKGTRIFVQGLRGRQTMVHSINRADGKYLWSKNVGSGGSNDRGSGPRSTPTIDGDRLYVLSEGGDLMCLREDGTQVWLRNILRDFSGSNIQWLLSESPLIDGDRVVVTPGGRGAASSRSTR